MVVVYNMLWNSTMRVFITTIAIILMAGCGSNRPVVPDLDGTPRVPINQKAPS